MNIEIVTKSLQLTVYGFSGTAVNKDYAGTAFKLMDKMWQIVKSNNLENKGLNIWIYEENEKVFAGSLNGSVLCSLMGLTIYLPATAIQVYC